MANPELIRCPKNQWTKIATNVVSGQIHKKTEKPQEYLSTFRETGDPGPENTEEGKEEGVPIFIDNIVSEEIKNSTGIDIYIYPVTDDGLVRVDI